MAALVLTLVGLALVRPAGGSPLPPGDAAPRASVSSPGPVPLRLGVKGAVNSGVSLAAQGSTVVATWAARGGAATDIYAAWSVDRGVTFGDPVRVNDVPGDARVSGEQAPRVALADGVRVVWVSRAADGSVVRTAAARTGERTFAPATTIHAPGLPGARGWAAHVAWLEGRGDCPRAGGAAPPPAAAHRHAGEGGLGGDAGRAAKAARQDLFHADLRPDGTRLETRVAADVCFCCKTAVAAGPGGVVYVAWRHIYPPNLRDVAVARSDDGGRTFGAPVRVSEDGWALDGCPDDGPAIGVDARGVLHVVWPTLAIPGGRKGIFYSRSVDGGRTFAPRARVDESPGGAAHPQLAVAGESVFVAWEEASGGRRRVSLREIIGNDGPEAPAALARMGPTTVLSAGPASYPALTSTPGAVVVAWTEEESAASVIRLARLHR
jgi:hypothetical protein